MAAWAKGPVEWMDEPGRICVSVVFTWQLLEVRRRLIWGHSLGLWNRALVGGPATLLRPDVLVGFDWLTVGTDYPGVLQRANSVATRTTTGCPRGCRFCGVRKIEPTWSELEAWPDLPVLADNNLLAASPGHLDRVMDRLERHGWADFSQGLDARLLDDHHAERIGRLRDPRTRVRLAFDTMGTAEEWSLAVDRLLRHGTLKHSIYTYALVGFRESPEDAWRRCDMIKRRNVAVLAMRYQPLDALKKDVITPEQREMGWTDEEFKRLLGYYWRRRGQKPDFLREAA